MGHITFDCVLCALAAWHVEPLQISYELGVARVQRWHARTDESRRSQIGS
jgi:hypothetical protein